MLTQVESIRRHPNVQGLAWTFVRKALLQTTAIATQVKMTDGDVTMHAKKIQVAAIVSSCLCELMFDAWCE